MFDFVDILRVKVFTEGILSLHKSENTDNSHTKKSIFFMFVYFGHVMEAKLAQNLKTDSAWKLFSPGMSRLNLKERLAEQLLTLAARLFSSKKEGTDEKPGIVSNFTKTS